ncbi:spore germination protein [Bacillus haynesii]|uniref:spore germination protein n=1 Tax=Bacillus TaxID=1386 RepID=UPI0012B7ADE1|nr:spore germination protein [Bacillus haynesii]TWK15593.1 putative spore germination protein GerPF [Bacillus licheniformis]MBU8683300.1 spore germination protein [Bacillus haynesii]MCY7800565.1 spore germination protein [Bacillus haynesii]MCY7837776.1 spore germination protein [Bacillus haynesii]MCY7846496.1 spore germination protein [Bacillus haynesii]
MPAIVGPIFIRQVVNDSAAFFGDVFAISPKCTDISGSGAGAFQTGDYGLIQNDINKTSFTDADVMDGSQSLNM